MANTFENGDASTTKNERPPHAQQPLETREVFLDTQVYRRLNYDLGNNTLLALFDHIDADRLRLHITDITLAEMNDHIAADAEVAVKKVSDARKVAAQWRRRAHEAFGKSESKAKKLNAKKAGKQAFDNFRAGLRGRGCTEHAAGDQSAMPVLRAYFTREAPFDSPKSKEFPDAFVIEKLSSWCAENDTAMYVVTADKAMLRAAEAKEPLRELDNLPALLEIATINHSPQVESVVDAVVEDNKFVAALETELGERISELGTVYMGDLADGEAEEVAVSNAPTITDWTVISASEASYGIIVEFDVDVIAQVYFEDRSMASYDKEDDVYFGAETTHTEIEDRVTIKMFVRTDPDGVISQSEMLTRDIDIYGPSDFYQ